MKTLYVTEREGRVTGAKEYVITKAINTIAFDIGEILSRAVAHEYCGSPDWKIIITKAGV